MKIDIKPLSVNEAWQGRRYKTEKYKVYERSVLLLLKPFKIDFKAYLRLDITFGVSSTMFDVDNALKPFIDVLQKKYGFNDNMIYELSVKKVITKKKSEFIKFEINNLKTI